MTNRFETIPTYPPANWERTTPLYRVSHDLHPSQNGRHRHESPFSQILDGACWQQADRSYRRGEIIESKEWPHSTHQPLNFAAKMVLQFFNSAPKSRLAKSPFGPDGRIRLDTGLDGALPNFATISKPRGDDRLTRAHPNEPRPRPAA
jgi:hypothetical protein